LYLIYSSMSKSLKDKKSDLEKQFQNIKNSLPNVTPTNHLVSDEDMPEFGNVEIYNYDEDVTESLETAREVIESLVDLYLGDSDVVKKHPYILKKMKDDSENYAESKLLGKITRKTLIQQLRQIDQGDNNARMYEVVNQTIKEQRENTKYSSGIKTEIEKFYRDIRKDLGLNELGDDIRLSSSSEDDGDSDGRLIDTKDLNLQISEILKNKK